MDRCPEKIRGRIRSEQATGENPDDEDARFNTDVVKKRLEQLKQQQQQQGDDKQDKENQDKNEQQKDQQQQKSDDQKKQEQEQQQKDQQQKQDQQKGDEEKKEQQQQQSGQKEEEKKRGTTKTGRLWRGGQKGTVAAQARRGAIRRRPGTTGRQDDPGAGSPTAQHPQATGAYLSPRPKRQGAQPWDNQELVR